MIGDLAFRSTRYKTENDGFTPSAKIDYFPKSSKKRIRSGSLTRSRAVLSGYPLVVLAFWAKSTGYVCTPLRINQLAETVTPAAPKSCGLPLLSGLVETLVHPTHAVGTQYPHFQLASGHVGRYDK
jgi:hypothetical protein